MLISAPGDKMVISASAVITARSAGDVAVFDIAGSLTRLNPVLPTLSELVKSKLNAGANRILIDFGKTGFVDSYGVGELLACFISTQNVGGKFKLCRVPAALALIFKITGLEEVLEVHPTEEAALAAFSR